MRRLRFMPLLLAISMSGCSDDDGVSPEVAALIGTWQLVSIDLGAQLIAGPNSTMTFTETTLTVTAPEIDCTVVSTYTLVDGTLTTTTTSQSGSECLAEAVIGEVAVSQVTISDDILTMVVGTGAATFTVVLRRV